MDREIALQEITDLVRRFTGNHDAYTDSSSDYNETQLRVDYLNPFL